MTQRDTSGGSGANFIVDWGATGPVEAPVIETVMVGLSGPHSLAFARPGTALKGSPPAGKD